MWTGCRKGLSTVADQRSPADRVQTGVIRAWGRDNGWPDLSDRGRLPPELRAAFEQAHGAEVEVSAMDEDDLDGLDPDLAPGTSPDDSGVQAPPADLDEARERAGRDPEPRHLVGRTRRGRPAKQPAVKQPAVKVTATVRADIEGKLAFWLSIPAEPWMRVDPYCGGTYAENVDQIALKVAPLVCQSPDLVRWFSKSTTFILWTELGIAVRPVVEAVIAHHVTKRIALTAEGEAFEQPGGGMDFAAYSARQPNPAAA
jgi:hypothetical protein